MEKTRYSRSHWVLWVATFLGLMMVFYANDARSGEKKQHRFDWKIELTMPPRDKPVKLSIGENVEPLHSMSMDIGWECSIEKTEFEDSAGVWKESKKVLCLSRVTHDLDQRPWSIMEASCSTGKGKQVEGRATMAVGRGKDIKNQLRIVLTCGQKKSNPVP